MDHTSKALPKIVLFRKAAGNVEHAQVLPPTLVQKNSQIHIRKQRNRGRGWAMDGVHVWKVKKE